MSEQPQRWVILVGGGYGAYTFYGTRGQAEEARAHKANWEHAIAKKRLADENDKPVSLSHCWNHPNFENKYWYECDCGECDSETRTHTPAETFVEQPK